jgi:cobalt-zinc-cadmium efflux system outer membrane protein
MASRLQEGTVPEADVLKVRADVARLDLDLVRARLDEEQRAIDLAYLVGAPGRLDPARFVEPEVTAPDERDDRALAAQLIRHPEARTSLARVARARQAFAVERARSTPDALVTGGFKRTAGFDTAVAGVAVTLPIFDRNGVATARADGEARAAEAEHAALLRRLTAEAQAASHAARALTARAASVARDLVAPADAVRLSAAAALREGAVDVLRLLDAERVLRDARHLAIDARLDGVAAAIAARLAAGEEALP